MRGFPSNKTGDTEKRWFHVDKNIAKAYSMLAFLNRICTDFDNLKCLSSIYNVSDRTWSTLRWYGVLHLYRLMTVSSRFKRKFVMFALSWSIRRNIDYEIPPYDKRRSLRFRTPVHSFNFRTVNISLIIKPIMGTMSQ